MEAIFPVLSKMHLAMDERSVRKSAMMMKGGMSMLQQVLCHRTIGPFQMLSILGHGAQGVVYRAVHTKTGAEVAIKAIRCQTSSMEALEHVQREVSLLRQMDHPFIVSFFDLLHNDTYAFFVMELVSGGCLGKYLREQAPLPETDCRRLFYEIVAVLDYLHTTKHVIHRDLKPENMLLDRNGDLRVIDFGLAKAWTTANPMMWTQCGSPHYAAPEVVSGSLYSTGADMWSAGVILYAMVAGTLPFAGPDIKTVWDRVLNHDPVMPPGLSPPLANLLTRLLIKEPDSRITLADVKQHPWFTGYTDWVSFPHTFADLRIADVAELDPRIVTQLRALDIETTGLLREVRDKRMNPRTAAYAMMRRSQIMDDLQVQYGQGRGTAKRRRSTDTLEPEMVPIQEPVAMPLVKARSRIVSKKPRPIVPKIFKVPFRAPVCFVASHAPGSD
jgi:serine/threonine protein kinase